MLARRAVGTMGCSPSCPEKKKQMVVVVAVPPTAQHLPLPRDCAKQRDGEKESEREQSTSLQFRSAFLGNSYQATITKSVVKENGEESQTLTRSSKLPQQLDSKQGVYFLFYFIILYIFCKPGKIQIKFKNTYRRKLKRRM